MKPTLYKPDSQEAETFHAAAHTLLQLPRTGPIVAVSLRVERNGASLVLHLESGEDVSVRRGHQDTWAQVIERFNADPGEDEIEQRRRGV